MTETPANASVFPLAKFHERPIPDINAFICDWKNKKDYTIIDYLERLHQNGRVIK